MLTDILKPRIAELGKIKVGGLGEKRKKRDGGEYRLPVKYDYFVVTTLRRNDQGDLAPDDELMKALAGEYGDTDGKLRQLPIAVLSNDPEEVMQSSYCWYAGKRCVARSDGKKLTVYLDTKTMQALPEPKELAWDARYLDQRNGDGSKRFKVSTTFNCVIVSKAARWGGVYKFRTTGRISSEQLLGSLLHLRDLTGGIIRGIPLRLVVRQMTVHPIGPNGQPLTTQVPVVHVDFLGHELQRIRQDAIDLARLEVTQRRDLQRAQLEYKQIVERPETVLEAADFADEFHPEPAAAAPPPATDPLAVQLGWQPPLQATPVAAPGQPATSVPVAAPSVSQAGADRTTDTAPPDVHPDDNGIDEPPLVTQSTPGDPIPF